MHFMYINYFIQDTVLALQGLAEMAALIYSNVYNLNASVIGTGVSEKFHIDQSNARVLQSRQVSTNWHVTIMFRWYNSCRVIGFWNLNIAAHKLPARCRTRHPPVTGLSNNTMGTFEFFALRSQC